MSRKHRRDRRVVTRSEYIIKRLLIILGCLLAVGVILGATVKIVTIVGRNRLTKNANSEGPSLSEDSDSLLKSDPVYASDWQEGWISLNGKVYEYNEDVRTFLILGIDNAHQSGGEIDYGELTAGGQSDSIFLVIVNPLDESIKILAINRDTKVNVLMVGIGEGGTDVWWPSEITVQHAFGGGREYSCELTRDAVSRLLYDMPIHGYVSVNYKAIPQINDAVGGVTLTLPEDMDVTEVNKSWVPGATITLKGQDAYDFVHYRNTGIFESQRMRVTRQKLYLNTFVKQMREKTRENITFPVTLFNDLKEYTVSDLTVDSIGYMASEYLGYTLDEDDIYTMEGETKVEDGFEYFYPDEDNLKELVIGLFYKEVDR